MLMRNLMLFVGVFLGCCLFFNATTSPALAASGAKSKQSSSSDTINKEHPGGVRLQIKMDANIHDAMSAVEQLNAVDAAKLVDVKTMKLVRHFDAVSPPMYRHAGRDAAKVIPGSMAGKAWLGKSGVTHFTLYGPYMKLAPGKYVVIFRLMLTERTTTHGIINVGVANAQSTVIERQVKTSEAPVGEWRVFAVPFTAKKELSTVEFRAWQHRHSVAIDRVYLFETN